ncbi:MAG: ATP-binding protein [Candidatus Eremiobacteraeota bacterium]|nr:ATP-binding protein [Candidatus Eremiobacteraeota bacterium]
MEFFELAKKRVSVFIWFLLLLMAYFAWSTPDARLRWPVIAGILGAFALLNLILVIPTRRAKVDSILFFLILTGFTFLITFYIVELGPKANLTILSLLYLFPLIAVSLTFEIYEALLMVLIIAVLEVAAAFLKTLSFQNLLSPETFGRIAYYVIIAVVVNYFLAENRKDLKRRDKEVMELRKSISTLDTSHHKLEGEKAEIEQVRQMLDREIRHSDTILKISKTFTQTLELQEILSHILGTIKEFLGFQTAGIFIDDKQKKEIYCATADGHYKEAMEKQAEDASTCMPGIAIRRNEAIIVNDISQDPRFSSIAASTQTRSALYMPIAVENEVYGSICLWSAEADAYTEKSLTFLTAIIHEAARAIKNAELYKTLDIRLNFIVALWNTSKNLASVVDLSSKDKRSVLQNVFETVKVLFEVDGVIFYLYHRETGSLVPSIFSGIFLDVDITDTFQENVQILAESSPGRFQEVELKDLIFPQQKVGEHKLLESSFQIGNLAMSSQKKLFGPFLDAGSVMSLYWAPLLGKERTIGAVVFLSKKVKEWTREESQWIDIFRNMISLNIESINLLEDIFSEKNQLEVLFDSMPEGVYTTDKDRKVLTWNKGAFKITGWAASETIGKECSLFIKCQNVDYEKCEKECYIRMCAVKGEKKESDIENVFIMSKNGERVPAYITAAPVYGKGKQVSGSLVVFRDITREKEIEKMKEEFLATITHDLKSPLASIMGYSELLTNPKLGELNKKQKDFAEAIMRGGKTLQILISNILSSSRLESGQMQYSMYDFSVNELFDELHEMFLPITSHKKINLATQIDHQYVAHGDKEKIKEVITNLISNAVKFTPEKGTITLIGEWDQDKVRISIDDTGKGIPEEEIPRLFLKFAQLKGEKQGTGLGLFIIKKIMEAHGQEISVKSTVGKGSTFMFHLEGRALKKETQEANV